MEFQYQQLQPNDFRLLRPARSPNRNEPDAIAFEIIHVPFAKDNKYSALSYTWGAAGNTDHIYLNGLRFPVRRNLFDALCRLRNSKLVEKHLWVDAICINQGEDKTALAERATQIQHMRQIYDQAARVVIWLGHPQNKENNRLAFEMMERFNKKFRKVLIKGRPYRPWWWPTETRNMGQDVSDFELSLAPTKDKQVFDVPGSKTHKAWLGIVSLWKAPWWTRTWIYQESTIPEAYTFYAIRGVGMLPAASSKVRFLCGDQEADWATLDPTFCAYGVVVTAPGLDTKFMAGAANSMRDLLTFRGRRVLRDLRTFLDILQQFRNTKCFDPRDKVYAPLCLAADDVRRFIIPDYAHKSVTDVYMDVARYYLGQPGHNLDFLGHTMFRKEGQLLSTPQGVTSSLPTWVPDFSESLQLSPIPKLLHTTQTKREVVLFDKRGVTTKEELLPSYQPLGGIQPSSVIDGTKLRLNGVFVDVLTDIIRNTVPNEEKGRAEAFEKSRRWALSMDRTYFTGEGYTDAYNRTFVLDLVYSDLGVPSERGGKLDIAFSRKARAELSLVEYRYQTNMNIAKRKAVALRDVGFCDKGQYLSMVPNTSMPGDQIWGLAGGQVLYVLRPVVDQAPGTYKYIGESYVHGLMDGDLVRRMQIGEMRMVPVCLV